MSNSTGAGKLMYLASSQATILGTGIYGFPFENPVTTNWDVMGRERVTVSLRSATLPVTWSVVTEENNTLVIVSAGIAYTLRLPLGSPTAQQIGSAISNFISANTPTSSPASGGYDRSRMQFFFESAGTSDATVGASGTTCQRIIGLAEPLVFTAGVPETKFCTNVVDLTGPRHVMVTVNLPMESTDSSSRTRGTLAAIPVDECRGSIIHYEPAMPFRLETSFDQIQQLVVELTDEAYVPLDLRGGRWAMVLQFS